MLSKITIVLVPVKNCLEYTVITTISSIEFPPPTRFNGCYDIINKIPLSDMLQHLTGGITETLALRADEGPEKLGHYLENCFRKRALILATSLKVSTGRVHMTGYYYTIHKTCSENLIGTVH
jgi:hypothetical protein